MKHLFPQYTSKQLAHLALMLLLLSIASGYFTFSGLSVGAQGFTALGDATVFAIASTIALFLFWGTVWATVPQLRSLPARIGGYSCVAFFLVLIFFLSSSFNVAGMSGGEGLELHLEGHVAELETETADVTATSMLVSGIAADLRGQSSGYAHKAESELNHGSYTGAPGEGSVYFALLAIKGRVDALLTEIDTFEAMAGENSAKARVILDTIRAVMVSDAAYRDRVAEIARQSDELRRLVASMNPAVMAEAVNRTLKTLPQEVQLHTNFSRNPKVAARQKAALDKVRADATQTISVLRGFVDQVATTAPPNLPSFERITPTQSVYRYWTQFLPHFAGGIALDWMPMAVLILASISIGSRSEAKVRRERVLATSVEDIIRADIAKEMVRGIPTPMQVKVRFQEDIHGPATGDGPEQNTQE